MPLLPDLAYVGAAGPGDGGDAAHGAAGAQGLRVALVLGEGEREGN